MPSLFSIYDRPEFYYALHPDLFPRNDGMHLLCGTAYINRTLSTSSISTQSGDIFYAFLYAQGGHFIDRNMIYLHTFCCKIRTDMRLITAESRNHFWDIILHILTFFYS